MAVSDVALKRVVELVRDAHSYVSESTSPLIPVRATWEKLNRVGLSIASGNSRVLFMPLSQALVSKASYSDPKVAESLLDFVNSQYNDVPYHNARHAFYVYGALLALFDLYCHSVDPGQVTDVLIAALAHDAKHTGIAGCDNKNIEAAIKQLPEFAKHFNFDMAAVKHHIHMTEFVGPDFLIDCPGVYLSRLLRDADLMGFMYSDWPLLLAGLATELNWEVNTGQDAEELVWNNAGFLAGRTVFNPVTAECITKYVLSVGIVLGRQVESRELLSKLRYLDENSNLRKYFQV